MRRAKSTTELVDALAKEGITSVETAWKGLGLFRSLEALSVSDIERDETHYLLVPHLSSEAQEANFVLYSKRVLPHGYGASNSLPKKRIFHLPDESAEERMRAHLALAFKQEKSPLGKSLGTGLASRLEELADELDRETDKMTGGLLLVGGLTALVNPVVGLGMIASGIVPKVGSKLAKSGASLVGDQLQGWSERRESKARDKEVARLDPEIFINPVLRQLEVILTNPSGEEDPLLEVLDWGKEFPATRYFEVTTEALREVYPHSKEEKNSPLRAPVRAWLNHLREVSADS